MEITPELIRKIGRLARILIKDEDIPQLTQKLQGIFGYMENLSKLDVSNVQPLSHVLGVNNVFRPDQVEESLPIEESLKNAPDASGRFIRVPLVVE